MKSGKMANLLVNTAMFTSLQFLKKLPCLPEYLKILFQGNTMVVILKYVSDTSGIFILSRWTRGIKGPAFGLVRDFSLTVATFY